MKIAYLILAHKNPNQLKRLVTRLSGDNSYIYIHLDNRTINVMDYFNAVTQIRNTYIITNRVIINWGAYSMVQATLNSLQQIIDSANNFDYIHLLSGQDYPIKNNISILDYLSRNKGYEFLSYNAFPTPELPDGGMDRIEYCYDFDNPVTAYNSPNYNMYEKEMKLKGIKREFIPGMKPYHGSQWWSLTENCIRYILNTIKQNSAITDFYKLSKFPDEQFFQTIVMNSEFSQKVLNNNLRYIDWSPTNITNIDWINHPPHPKILELRDFTNISRSSALFARKFDENIDTRILDSIDAYAKLKLI